MQKNLTQQLKDRARDLDFNMVGVIPAVPAGTLQAYMQWVARGMHGEMAYMARPDRIARRQDLNEVLPGIRSIVCMGLGYYHVSIPEEIAADPSRGRISNYAWGYDYHAVMLPRLKEVARWLEDATDNQTVCRIFVDTGAILERDHASSAGLGFTGKNTMLIAPRRGSWFFLGELLTTATLEYDVVERKMPGCGRCHRCLDACPTKAFPTPYVLDARRCISYLTIELKGWIPRPLRSQMGNWVYGCDVCQEVCPFNRFARPTPEVAFQAADWNAAAPPLLDLLGLDDDGFAQRFAHSPIKRIKRRGLLRNACVAAGNWGSLEAVPVLARLLTDPEAVVRGHAAWALHRIGGRAAKAAISDALAREVDEAVRKELIAGAE